MLDSRAFLRQAEEKFLSGRLSETEYIDLRRDLQKMVESSEYELFRSYSPQKQVKIVVYDKNITFRFYLNKFLKMTFPFFFLRKWNTMSDCLRMRYQNKSLNMNQKGLH